MHKLIFIGFYFGLQSQLISAQENSLVCLSNTENSIDSVYGHDQILYNGKQSAYIKPKVISGNQFLFDENYLKGKIKINGTTYSEISINYDIYNQQLLLKYLDITRGEKTIIVSKAWLEEFEFKGMHFKQLSTSEFPQRFYQVIGNDSTQILIFYKKELILSGVSGTPTYIFSKPIKNLFIKMGNQIIKYKNTKSFVLLFDLTKQDLIMKYIKQNRVNIKKSSDESILKLITYCNYI